MSARNSPLSDRNCEGTDSTGNICEGEARVLLKVYIAYRNDSRRRLNKTNAIDRMVKQELAGRNYLFTLINHFEDTGLIYVAGPRGNFNAKPKLINDI